MLLIQRKSLEKVGGEHNCIRSICTISMYVKIVEIDTIRKPTSHFTALPKNPTIWTVKIWIVQKLISDYLLTCRFGIKELLFDRVLKNCHVRSMRLWPKIKRGDIISIVFNKVFFILFNMCLVVWNPRPSFDEGVTPWQRNNKSVNESVFTSFHGRHCKESPALYIFRRRHNFNFKELH